MDSEVWMALYQIFKMGGHRRAVLLGTSDFGKLTGTSQQTASRRLLQLVKEGYVTRELTTKGQNIAITEKGLAELKDVYHTLRLGFEEGANVVFLNGFVFSGFGEGAYYVTKNGYREQFPEKLGFQPYPGTLNLRLKSVTDIKVRNDLGELPSIIIKGFRNGERTFGDVKAFKVLINDKVEGAILMIHRTHYGSDVLEIVSREPLRKSLSLSDGDPVQLKVLLDWSGSTCSK
jgi:riboflavin kinase